MRKPFTPHDIPPPLELECLKALWQVGTGTVKDVRGVVTESRNLAYTTVMTVLDRLEKRGSVQRKKVGRSFVYTPVVGEEELRRLAVQLLIDTLFGGSKERLIAFLDDQPVAEEERSTWLSSSATGPSAPDTLDTELL